MYTVEVRNRFKGLDLIDRMPDELWTEVHDIVQETGIKTIPMEKKCKKGKMAVWGGLTNSCEKRSKKQRRKGKIHPFSQIEGFHLISTLLCFGSLKMVFYCLLVWIFLTKCLCFSFYLITYNVSFSFLLVRQYSLFHLFSEILSSCAFIQFYFVFLLGFLWIFLCLCV